MAPSTAAPELYTCTLDGNPDGEKGPATVQLKFYEQFGVAYFYIANAAGEMQFSMRDPKAIFYPKIIEFNLYKFDRVKKRLTHTFADRTVAGPCVSGSKIYQKS